MVLIEWRAEYEVGIADVDHEHRELVELINDLYVILVESPDSPHAHELLGELYARIAAHFALEERVMRDHDYDEYAAHKADHERLLDDLLDLMDDFDGDSVPDVSRYGERLHEWFATHFTTRDARLHHRLG